MGQVADIVENSPKYGILHNILIAARGPVSFKFTMRFNDG